MTRAPWFRDAFYIYTVLAISYVVAARAPGDLEDAAAEFSNAIISDLGPLIALFGEQVTKQFLSQAMTWWDHIIFAMAPLGIITAIVSAIRVGGPGWLRAIVGRARESRGATEVELMSSTSEDVCELWDGNQIVRVMGTSPVVQLLYFPEYCDNKTGGKTCGLYTLMEALNAKLLVPKETGSLRNAYRSFIGGLMSVFKSHPKIKAPDPEAPSTSVDSIIPDSASIESTPSAQKQPAGAVRTSKDNFRGAECSPNIVLNYEERHLGNRRFLPYCAIGGALLQLGVLVADGLLTYYPTMKLYDIKSPISSSAFHLTVLGTLLVVVGMALCSLVIELCTTEVVWESVAGKEFYLLWVQKGQVVNDQQFQSYVLLANGKRTSIMTSFPIWFASHIGTSGAEDGEATTSAKTSSTDAIQGGGDSQKGATSVAENSEVSRDSETMKENKINQIAVHTIEWLVVGGTVISVCGFILQFTGLRGMHWSATVIQLGATVLMTIVRSLIRLDITNKPRSQCLPKGLELEMLSLQLANLRTADAPTVTSEFKPTRLWESQGRPNAASNDRGKGSPKNKEYSRRYRWDLCINWSLQILGSAPLSHETPSLTSCSEKTSDNHFSSPSPDMITNLVDVRTRLAKLTGIKSPAREIANSLQLAIESVMNQLFLRDDRDDCTTASKISQSNQVTWPVGVSANKQKHTTHITLKRSENGGKRWQADEDELDALLALSSFKVGFKVGQEKDGSSERKWAFVLGPPSMSSHMFTACNWWAKERMDMLGVMEKNKTTEGEICHTDQEPLKTTIQEDISVEDLVGYIDDGTIEILPENKIQISALEPTTDLPQTASGPGKVLVTTSFGSDYHKNALHLFSVFMLAAANASAGLEGRTEVNEEIGSSSDSLNGIKLRNTAVTKIIQGVQQTSLCSKTEAHLLIIAALETARKLPLGDTIIKWAQNQAMPHEKRGRYDEAAKIYIWLLRTYTRFGGRNKDGFVKAIAVFLEFSRNVNNAVALSERLHGTFSDERENLYTTLKKVQKDLFEEQKSACLKMEKDLSEEQKSAPLKMDKDFIFSEQGFQGYVMQLRFMSCMMDKISVWDSPDYEDKSSEKPTKTPEEHIKTPEELRKAQEELIKAQEELIKAREELTKALEENQLFGLSNSHFAAVVDCKNTKQPASKVNSNEPRPRDILYRTPLHYIGIKDKEYIDAYVLDKINVPMMKDVPDIGGLTPLHYAVCLQNTDAVRSLLKLGCDTKLKARDGMTALHYAAARCHTETGVSITQMLLEKGGDECVHDRDNYKRTPLHWALIAGTTQVAIKLLNHGASSYFVDCDGRTPLHLAATSKELPAVSELVNLFRAKNADFTELLKKPDSEGMTVLHLVSKLAGNVSLLEALLPATPTSDSEDAEGKEVSKTADVAELVNIKDHYGRTPLSWAAEKGHLDLIDCLLDRKAEVNAKDNKKQTPLLQALRGENLMVAEKLRVAGALVDPNNKKRDLMSWAAETGQKDLLVALLEVTESGGMTPEEEEFMGTINSTDDSDQTPLIWASKEGHEEAVKVLLSCPHVDITREDTGKRTALIWAASNGHEKVAELLISMATSGPVDMLNAADSSGQTALLCASLLGHSGIVRMLLETNLVDVNRTGGIRTPLSWAMEEGHTEVVKLLLSCSKVDVNSSDPYWRYTPFGWAIEIHQQMETIEFLINNPRVDLNLKDPRYNKTPLQLAVALAENTSTGSFDSAINHQQACRIIELLISTNRIELDQNDGAPQTIHYTTDRLNNRSPWAETILGGKYPRLFALYGGALLKAAILWKQTELIEKCISANINELWKDRYEWTPLLCARVSRDHRIQELFAKSPLQLTIPPPPTPTITWSCTDKSNVITLDETALTAKCVATQVRGWQRYIVQASSPFSRLIYFEIHIINPAIDDIIGIGLCNGPPRFDTMLPGWHGPNVMSWGYHGDDGEIYAHDSVHEVSTGIMYEKYSTGHIIGCGVDKKNRIFFTKNGKYLGAPKGNISGQLFAIVGFGGLGEIRANFGQEDFVYKWNQNSENLGVQYGIPPDILG